MMKMHSLVGAAALAVAAASSVVAAGGVAYAQGHDSGSSRGADGAGGVATTHCDSYQKPPSGNGGTSGVYTQCIASQGVGGGGVAY